MPNIVNDSLQVPRKRLRCFIISPIGPAGSPIREEADAVLTYLIRPALEKIANAG